MRGVYLLRCDPSPVKSQPGPCVQPDMATLSKAGRGVEQAELRKEAHRLAEEFREANKAALLNLLSDSTAALTLFAMLLRNTEGRVALFSTFGRVLSGLSDTAKAFLIIAGRSSHARQAVVLVCCIKSE